MKCGALVRREEKGKKKRLVKTHLFSRSAQVIDEISFVDGYFVDYANQKTPESEFERCDGNVKANVCIGMTEGCSCCGTSYIEIEYTCDKCGCNDFRELPQDAHELSDFLTKYIESISETERKEDLTKKAAFKKEQDLKVQQMLDSLRRRRR